MLCLFTDRMSTQQAVLILASGGILESFHPTSEQTILIGGFTNIL